MTQGRDECLRVLCVGDVVGKPGRKALRRVLPLLCDKYGAFDFIIANGENAASGFGITGKVFRELTDMGVAAVTMGNHTWDNRGIFEFIEREPRLIRPANVRSSKVPGRGWNLFDIADTGKKIAVISLMGRTDMRPAMECPFHAVDEILSEIAQTADYVFVDFHAEATSEKYAMARHLDGRATCVFGTHTHVQTNDARILQNGIAYITDLGMTGGHGGVIGVTTESVLPRFLTGMPSKFAVCDTELFVHGVVVTLSLDARLPIAIDVVKESVDGLS